MATTNRLFGLNFNSRDALVKLNFAKKFIPHAETMQLTRNTVSGGRRAYWNVPCLLSTGRPLEDALMLLDGRGEYVHRMIFNGADQEKLVRAVEAIDHIEPQDYWTVFFHTTMMEKDYTIIATKSLTDLTLLKMGWEH